MKYLTLFLIAISLFSCSGGDKNPLIIPPKFAELPDLNSVETKKTQENVGNQENIDKLKKMLQESDENQQ
jgi:hypothetical protein